MKRVVRISGLACLMGQEEINKEVWRQTRDMDSIVLVKEIFPRKGDGHQFIVSGTPRVACQHKENWK